MRRPRGERCPWEGVGPGASADGTPPRDRRGTLRCGAVRRAGAELCATGPGGGGGHGLTGIAPGPEPAPCGRGTVRPAGARREEKDGRRRKRPPRPAPPSTHRDGRTEPRADGRGSPTAPAAAAHRSAPEGSGAEGRRGPTGTNPLRAAVLLRTRHRERCVWVVFQPRARSQKRGGERSKVHQQKYFKDYSKAGEEKKKKKKE